MIIDSAEAARRLKMSVVRVKQLLQQGRIVGGQKVGGQRGIWIIEVPDDQPPKLLPPNRRGL